MPRGNFGPCTKERRQNISRALKGRKLSKHHRANISKALFGKSHTGVSPSKRIRQKISTKLRGRKLTTGHKENISKGMKKHVLFSEGCNCLGCTPLRQINPSRLSWKMYDVFLSDFEIAIPEVQFGNYSVDFLLAEEWIAFEADGEYWHGRPGAQERDIVRDAWLLKMYNLPVIRISEQEINDGYSTS